MPLISPIISSRSENTSLYALAGAGGGLTGPAGPSGPTGPTGPASISVPPLLGDTLADYPAAVPGTAIRGGLYYNGQSLPSETGGDASALIIFDTTSTPNFTAVNIPANIRTGLSSGSYSILQVSGTIPMYLGPTGTVSTFKCALLRMSAVDVSATLTAPLTIWMPPALEIPNIGTTFPFTFYLKVGTNVLTTSTQIQIQLGNPDFNTGSTIYIGGSGAQSSANVLEFLLF
jgi:hypothetical protein